MARDHSRQLPNALHFTTILTMEFPHMHGQNLRLHLLTLLLLAFCAAPTFAASVDCSRATDDAVAKVLCSHPGLTTLDGQLSAAYAQALARLPVRASAIKEDQLNWLGERNRVMWSSLAPNPDSEFPPNANQSVSELQRFYAIRIAFLRNLGDPAATRSDPIAQKLLAFATTLPARDDDTVKALQSARLLQLPESLDTDQGGAEKAIGGLAAPPDLALQAALKELDDGVVTVEYIASAGIGGAYTVGGTAECQNWVWFEKRGNATVPRPENQLDGTVGCMRDGGATEHPAVLDGQPVVLAVTHDNFVANQMDLAWQRWQGGGRWGPLLRLRFRYRYELAPNAADGSCQGTPTQCAETASMAVELVRHYLRNPWTLPAATKLPAAERAQFARSMADAPDRKTFAAIAPAWFPLHLQNQRVVVGIDYTHIGSHINTGAFDVGFWGQANGAGPWWFVDQNVVQNTGRLLGAALIPPGESH